MKLERSKPPALAVWLLRHLTSKKTGEAIAGDLAEQFNEHGSAAKFWREALVAIATGAPQSLRLHWLAICVALSGAVLDYWFDRFLWKDPVMLRLWVSGISFKFPLTIVYGFGVRAAMAALVIWPVLILSLVLFRALNWANTFRVLLMFFVLDAAGDVAVWMLTSLTYYQTYRFAFVFLLCLWLIRPGIGEPRIVQHRVVG